MPVHRNARSMQAKSIMYDMNHHQLRLILERAIFRLDALHKTVTFIQKVKLDGRAFMTLTDKTLLDLACNDPLLLSRFRDLRTAQPRYIHSLLSSGRERSPEPTPTQEETSNTEDLHDDHSPVRISNEEQSHTSDIGASGAENLAMPSRSLESDIPINIDAQHTFTDVATSQTPTDAISSDTTGLSLNQESAAFIDDAARPAERTSVFEPAAGAQLGSTSTDPHTVSLPQPDDSELSFLNEEAENTLRDEVFSDEAVGSELESAGLSSNDDRGDDESQSESMFCLEEVGDVYDNEVEGLQGSFDVIHNCHIEHPSDIPEEPSASRSTVVDAASETQSDQTICARADFSPSSHAFDPDGQVEQSPQLNKVGPSPPPAENVDFNKNHPNVSEPELSGNVQETHKSNESLDTGQSFPDRDPDPSCTVVFTPEESSRRLSESPASVLKENCQAHAMPFSDNPPSTGLSNMDDNFPEIIHHSATSSTEEVVINDPPEEQTNSDSASNELVSEPGEVDSETILLPETPPLVPDPVTLTSSEIHVVSKPPADDSVPAVLSTEEERIASEALGDSSQNVDIPIAYAGLSPSEISVEFDMSTSFSPSSSSRSIFSDSPFSTRINPDVFYLSPVSPVLCLLGGKSLLFYEGAYEDNGGFMTSTPIDITQFSPFLSKPPQFEDLNTRASFPNDLRLVDHPLPISSDTVPDDLLSVDPFHSVDEPHPESASSSMVRSLDLLDEPILELSVEVDSEGSFPPGSVSAPLETLLLDCKADNVSDIPFPSASSTTERQDDDHDDPPSDCLTAQVVQLSGFKGLPPIDTNVTSLMDDPEVSAFLSPEDHNPHGPIVPASSPTVLSSRPRLSPPSPTRSLFPMSEIFASSRNIENYSKRLYNVTVQTDFQNP